MLALVVETFRVMASLSILAFDDAGDAVVEAAVDAAVNVQAVETLKMMGGVPMDMESAVEVHAVVADDEVVVAIEVGAVVAAQNKAVVTRLSWTSLAHIVDVTDRGHGRFQPYSASLGMLQRLTGWPKQA